MADYRKMYTLLFNAITSALEQLDKKNAAEAAEILKAAQRQSEELYIETSGE